LISSARKSHRAFLVFFPNHNALLAVVAYGNLRDSDMVNALFDDVANKRVDVTAYVWKLHEPKTQFLFLFLFYFIFIRSATSVFLQMPSEHLRW